MSAVRVVNWERNNLHENKLVAAEAIAAGQPIGVHSDGTAFVALAASGASGKGTAIGFAVKDAASGEVVRFSRRILLRCVGHTITPGVVYYLGAANDTLSCLTATRPTTNTYQIQPLGVAINTTDVLLSADLPSIRAATDTTGSKFA